GVTHYLIHSYDVPTVAARGLPYARRYADLVPRSSSRIALQKEPNRFRSVYGTGHAAELAGSGQKARTYYQQTVKICGRGERQIRPELDHAASYVGGTR